jgi:hypothetical protein
MVHHSRGVCNPAPVGTSPADYLQLALLYHSWGFRTFPLFAKNRPACPWKPLRDVKYSDRLIGRLFRKTQPIRGLALIVGPLSNNIAVRDFDDKTAAKAWTERYPQIAERTPIVITRRGIHVYFRLPPGHPPVYSDEGDGELRGSAGQYVVLPPSWHSEDAYYRWHRTPTALSDFPVLNPVEAGLQSCSSEAADDEIAIATNSRRRAAKAKTNSRNPTQSNTYTSCVPFVQKSEHQSNSAEESAPSLQFDGHVSGYCPVQDRTHSVSSRLLTIEEIIEQCVPERQGRRNASLWKLCRLLKGMPQFESSSSAGLLSIVKQWHRRSIEHLRTKDFSTSWADFCRQWEMVEVPYRWGAHRAGLAVVTKFGITKGVGDERAVVLELARELAHGSANGEFFLSCRVLEETFGIPKSTAARHLKWWIKKGELILVREGQMAGRKASVYRLPIRSVSRAA